jgi:16S rRNA (guanine527-N7)-methyltransferase
VEQDPIQVPELLKKSAGEAYISLPDCSIPHFCTYLNELKKWNKVINLTAIDGDREIVVKHFIDSLAGLKVIGISNESELLDVGAGAGFPSIPIKLVRPELSIELLEPSEKKGSFLRYVIGSLGIRGASVATIKLENYVKREANRKRFDYIVVRAFRVDALGIELGSLLKDDGKLVLFRAAKVEPGFRLDSLALSREVEYELPSGYGHRALSVFSRQTA